MAQHYLTRAIWAAALSTALLLLVLFAQRFSKPRARPAAATDSGAVTSTEDPPRSTLPAPQVESTPKAAPVDRRELVRQCLHTAETDVLSAMDFAVAHQLAGEDPGLLTTLVLRWAEQDFAGALGWVRAQARGTVRDQTLARLAYLRARSDPLAAARLVVADIAAGPARDEAIISVVHQWALQDAEAAELWARSLTNEPLRQRALAEVEGRAATFSPTKPIK